MFKRISLYKLLPILLLTISFVNYLPVHAQETATQSDFIGEQENRLDFDTEKLEEAKQIINNSSQLDASQKAKLYQMGFTDSQIQLLIDITKNPCTADTNKLNQPYQFLYILPVICLLLMFISGYKYHHKKT